MLRDNEKGEIAEILYREGRGESSNLAGSIRFMFDWAGWKVGEPSPYTKLERDAGFVNAILLGQWFGDKDVVVISKSNLDFFNVKPGDALWSLLRAMAAARLRVGTTADGVSPAKTVRLVIVPQGR